MTAFNFRSLLLAAIVLSNCITWTASRHHYTHNVYQHRTRHRRQGAGLFLSASYVIPGGEGGGAWGEWGEVSPCSRTCGGGVASQKRICLQLGPDGQPECTGGDTKYFSCQTQDCPAGSIDFRAEQCAEFDNELFRGYKYNWVPYTKAPNPCQLNCMPHGERFYYQHQAKVIDGTRCNDESFDVCVNGICQPVGCDMMLGSNAREDKCRECRGTGANCHTTAGIFDSQDLMKGYNDILLIPQGSTSIVIEEVQPSNNYLALRAKNGTYYLNGHYHIDFPRSMMIAGALWYYERSQGFAAPDKLRCLGPTSEPLYLSLLLQDENVGISYEYSVPNESAPPADKRYNWVHEEFTPCSATCGGGFQTRNVTCRSREELEVVDEGLCDEGLKPPTNQSCSPDPCPAQWVESEWGECSKRCGSGGVKSREVNCQKIIANGYASIVADKECFDLLGPKPELFQECNNDAPCPTWFVGKWKPCDNLCDEGTQKRQIVCYQKKNGRIEVLDDKECTEEKPVAEQSCFLQPCDGVDWVTTDWAGCDTCFSKNRTRTVMCATKGGVVMDHSFCEYHLKPVDQEPCDADKLPPCEVQWYATQWSKCSVECGDGVQTRQVFCGMYNGESVSIVEDAKCAELPKYKDTKNCTVPKDECPAQWFAGQWSECTKECGGGEQYRRVMCLKGDKEVNECDGETVLDSTQFCNTGPCDKDETLPVDAKSTPIMDDGDEECDYDADYTEVGLDEDLLSFTTLDMMMSDAAFGEPESSLDTGSGFDEGSGYFSSFATGSDYTTDEFTTEDVSTDVTTEGSTIDAEKTSKTTAVLTPKGSDTTTAIDESEATDTGATTEGTDVTLTGETDTEETGSTETSETSETGSTESGATEETDTTSTDDSTDDSSTPSTDDVSTTESETQLTDSSSTDSSVTETEITSETETELTSETGSGESTLTTDGESTGSDDGSSTVESSTVSGDTDVTGTETTGDESTVTEETGSTESTVTEETGSTESTVTEETESTESTVTEETETTETSSTEFTEETGTTPTSDTESTDSTTDGSTLTTGDETTASDLSSESPSSKLSDETTKTTAALTPTYTGSTTELDSSESSTDSSGVTDETTELGSTTEGGSTVSSSEGLESSTVEGSTEFTSESSTFESTSLGSTESTDVTGSSVSESSDLTTGSEGTDATGSESTTEGGSTTEGSTVSGDTESTYESTSESGSTQESTEESSTSGYSTETGSTEESTTEGSTVYSSTESSDTASTEVSGSTTEGLSTTEGSTTEGVIISTGSTPRSFIVSRKPFCKPRKSRKPKCEKSEFGCCPDKKHAAAGPFDAGCPKPRTCKESMYGCCPDGLSPALGDNNEGCPVEPCVDTLFGCCQSDNKTAAQGNDQDGCPPPPPACMASKFGCCADNETEASGPKHKGCPEAETTTIAADTDTTGETTESSGFTDATSTASESSTDYTAGTTEAEGCGASAFGCCPDGVSPAQGAALEGCPEACTTSPHGCCQDGKTPAHGPDFEGCCLLQAFGCCPDNRKPAEGPHLEGCGCQYARHGCCPDNVTIAQGPDNQGCGCEYTENGCCPDRHTAASGPNNEGCGCNTYQFGCCEDGVTVAKGPDQQGCHCRDSKYGCCGDGETPATGPNSSGCDCSSSQHGCCPDGNTAASGPKFLGCTDAPENRQAVCSLSTDPGPCHNFTATWYYDLAYGGCSRFWYGGCEGNGNRFANKEDCEDVCVQPAPKDACKLPSVKGPCDADYVRWHYNSSREQCIPFRYGGCLGNANNFDTRELCQTQCEPDRTANQCSLPIEQGPCAGNFGRWGFNAETRRCEQFIWGGCEGNSNRFSSEAACLMRCDPPGAPKPECSEPQDAGSCSEKQALWSFSQSENRCVPFYYSGCGGNANKFVAREHCEQACPSAYVPDKCTLPAEVGQCSNYREKWFYDTSIKRCRQFYYGGCGGNENNFGSAAECESSCSEAQLTTTTTTVRSTQPQPQESGREAEPEPDRPEFCFMEVDSGPCTTMETRYAYDSALGRCRTFEYGGCGGNRNNFPNELYCTHYCHPVQDICQLPMQTGPCDDSLMRWFYDPTSDSCSQFTYGGCEGNDNRFESREACESRCRTGPAQNAARTTVAPTTPVIDARFGDDIPEECRIAGSLEQCASSGEVWYLEPSTRECAPFTNQESGDACRYRGTFASQEACERSCGAFRGVDVCQQRLDPGPCTSYATKVYFDAASGQCLEFAYGGCLGGANRFSSVQECAQVCKAQIDVCSLPPEEGNCLSYIQQWYYDASRDQCNQFVYTGCSGNDNRFETQQDCEARCRRPAITTTTPAVSPQQTAEQECVTPTSLVPCGENSTVFYYDSEQHACLASEFGGCGHPNSYASEEECERRCGAFRGLDVCGFRLDPGPCRASFPKFYWDSLSASCQPFAYGGCAGGPNRFSTVDECERVCGAAGPARECLQAVDTGTSCAAPQSRRWHYSALHLDCVVFVYQGCGGNDNNFHSYDECSDVCKFPRSRGDDYNQVGVSDCYLLQQECDALVCPYGLERFEQDGCQRCRCREDPCVSAACSDNERCVAVATRDSRTQEPVYSARCVADHETNEVLPDCEAYVAECNSLRCEYGVQRRRTADGCERCACVTVEVNCDLLKEECRQLNCTYGKEMSVGADGCERCTCKEHPCSNLQCAQGERCVVSAYRDAVDFEPKYSSECRIINKPGMCPMDETTANEVSCRHECSDDADCRGVGKCCRRGCSDLCILPAEDTPSPRPVYTTTYSPDIPSAPLAIPQQEPEVAAAEGGTATLRCLFHGNPPPKITWRRGELTIDGTVGRYRLTSDGALEIVSLYRNDTGVYICVADNGLGEARQEIHLVVNDPVRMQVGIAGDENAVVTGELGRPLTVRCLAYGYPQPTVFWYRGYDGNMVPYNDAIYEARGNVLLIRSLAIETLGEYTCQAYNGEGKAASWVVAVQAYRPEGIFAEHQYLVPRYTVAPMAKTNPTTTRETTTTTTTEQPMPLFTVPVSTHLTAAQTMLNIGAELRLTCEVDGFPDPVLHWTKDGASIQNDDRTSITSSTIVSRLLVARVSVGDSGLYACHARNAYSSHSDTVQINVQQLIVPAKCTDNPFFANCDLIVHSKFCRHKYYSKFCCKSCVEAGQLDPQEAELQADQPFRRK